MPEMRFHVRWPDGTKEACYSPSLVIKDFLAEGKTYPLDDFVARSREALGIASERVRQKFGMPCARALGQLARIEARAKTQASADATVVVEAFEDESGRNFA